MINENIQDLTDHLSIEGTRSPSNNHPTNFISSHSQDVGFAEGAIIIRTALPEDVGARTKTQMATKKASTENLLQAVQRSRSQTKRGL
ncbi:hypothetical protein ACTXT7_011329 [Hymenolepis weldensis]